MLVFLLLVELFLVQLGLFVEETELFAKEIELFAEEKQLSELLREHSIWLLGQLVFSHLPLPLLPILIPPLHQIRVPILQGEDLLADQVQRIL